MWEGGCSEVFDGNVGVCEAGVRAEALLFAEFTLHEAGFLGFGFIEEVDCGAPEGLDLFGGVLAFCAERETVDGDEGMVCDYVDTVAVPEVCVESVPYTNLNSSCETQVMVSRQAAYDLPSWLPRSWVQPGIAPMLEEYIPKTPVFVHPKVVAISTVLRVWRLGRARRPFAPAVKQVAQEEYSIGIQNGLQARVCTAQIEVGVLVCERVDGPRAARVSVRIDELRVGDEDESVGVCAGFLDSISALCHW